MDRTRNVLTPENILALRQVNDTVWEAVGRAGGIGDLTLLCECGGDYCADDVQMTEQEYRMIRDSPGCRAVAPGHVVDSSERVLLKRTSYWVVEPTA